MSTFIEPEVARGIVSALAFATVFGTALIVVVFEVLRRRQHLSADLQHQLIVVSLASLVVLSFAAPGVAAPVASGMSEQARFTFAAAGKFAAGHPPAAAGGVSASWTIVLWVWASGVLVLLGRLAWRLAAVARLRRQADDVVDPAWRAVLDRARADLGIRGRVALLTHDAVTTPMIWGPPAAFIVIPREMLDRSSATAGARLTLLHELAHLVRKDALWKLAADVVCALNWFNPLAWMARKRLDLAQEMAADSRVLQAGERPSTYSSHLLELFRNRVSVPLALAGVSSVIGESPLSSRLSSILERGRDHRASSRSVSTLVGFGSALCFGALVVAQTELGASRKQPLHDLLNPIFVNKMADAHIAGAAMSVVKDGQVVYQRGFGRAEVFAPKPVVADRTVFRIGSVTKVVTGLAVMQCVDRGLLDLEADVNRYLTEFKVDDTFPEPVRVKHLLTHTAGFDQLGYDRHVSSRDSVLPLAEFLKDNLVRIRPPDQVSCYDTYAITLAGYLVEVVSGSSFEGYLSENIFGPLDMDHTFITVPEAYRDDLATGYEFRGEWVPQRWEYMNTDPASTVNSTVADMANLATMFLEGGEYGGQRILSKESVAAMMTRQFTNHPDQPGYGLTLFEDPNYGVPAFSHGGSMTGFACFLYLVPEERLGMFVAYNQESGQLGGLAMEAVVDHYLSERKHKPGPKPRVDGVALDRFVGEYANNGYNHSQAERGGWRRRPFTIAKGEGGALMFQGRACFAVGELAFQSDDGLLLTFLADGDGAVTHLVVQQTVLREAGLTP